MNNILGVLEYLKKIKMVDKNNFKNIALIYGNEDVNLEQLIDIIDNDKTISKKEKKEALAKFDEIINSVGEENICEIDKINDDMDVSDFLVYTDRNGSYINGVGLYIEQISRYPLLTREEELEYGKDLKLIDDIDIVVSKKYNNKDISLIDLEKVFLSINNEEDKNYVISILDEYLSKYARSEAVNDKIVSYYLMHYNKLYERLGKIPNVNELNLYFAGCREYDTFSKFDVSNKMDFKEMCNQVSNYIKYMVAFNSLFKSNLRLVIKVAKRYYGKMEFADMIEDGNLGLIKAIEKYDVDKGYRFSTYAYWWIRQGITRGISNKGYTIRIPVWMREKITKFNSEVVRLENKYCRRLSADEIAGELNISVDEIMEYIKYNKELMSLDAPIDDEESITYGDFVEANCDVFSDVSRLELKKLIIDMLDSVSNLTERERKVIELRFGLVPGAGTGMNLAEIGRELGVTRERVRQNEAKALKKLNPYARVRGFEQYLK